MSGLVGLLPAMGAFAVLFALFGLWVRNAGCGGDCDSCTPESCERKDASTD